jgi:hypothetical protein
VVWIFRFKGALKYYLDIGDGQAIEGEGTAS